MEARMSSIPRRNPDGSARIRIKTIILGAAGAGKTSLLRRYFNHSFDKGTRVPTLGSDFYTGRVPNPVCHAEDEKKDADKTQQHQEEWVESITRQPYLSLQMWDTAGRERFVAGRTTTFTASLSDDFFRQADAAMLCYDATSSTSFTQLLKWHSDLLERMKLLDEKGEKEGLPRRKRPFPIVIVANKMDLFQHDMDEPQRQHVVPQRDIMGFCGQFRGKDSRYEYSVPAPAAEGIKSDKRRFEISTYMATGDSTWTTDGSYLDSVLTTEDVSHPDRDMVLLWCMRNGLKHFEVSALEDSGVNEAMEYLITLALGSYNDRETDRVETLLPAPVPFLGGFRRNKSLDLHERYAKKDDGCCFPFSRCCKS
jgi:Ras-related protein Rab-7A